MKRTFYYTLLSIGILGIPVFLFGIINTMVSIKYETESPGDCISIITGANLCQTVNTFKILVGLSIISSIFLIFFRKKILKDSIGH